MKIKDIFKSKAEREEEKKAAERLQRTVARMTGQIPLYNESERVKKPQEVKEVGQFSTNSLKQATDIKKLEAELRAKAEKELRGKIEEEFMAEFEKKKVAYEEYQNFANKKRNDNARVQAEEKCKSIYEPIIKKNENRINYLESELKKLRGISTGINSLNTNKITTEQYEKRIKELNENHRLELRALEQQYENKLKAAKPNGYSMPGFSIRKAEPLETKRTYKLRPSTIAALEEVKKKLYPKDIDITLNELADEAIQVYCQIKHKR